MVHQHQVYMEGAVTKEMRRAIANAFSRTTISEMACSKYTLIHQRTSEYEYVILTNVFLPRRATMALPEEVTQWAAEQGQRLWLSTAGIW